MIKIVEPSEEARTRNTFHCDLDSETSKSEDNDCEENIVSAAVIEHFDNEELFGITYPVTRTERMVSAKQKEALENEYQQQLKKQKPNRNRGDKDKTTQ